MTPDRPDRICHNCYVVWRAKNPRVPAVFCHHTSTAARLGPDGAWRVLEQVGRAELARLREAGLL